MELEREDMGGAYVGVVKRSGVIMCRILLAGDFKDRPLARSALADRARMWIADYLRRPHEGDPDSQACDVDGSRHRPRS